MEFGQIVNEKMNEIIKSGAVETMIKTQLESTVKSIVNDFLKEYSDFGKGLKKQIQTAVAVDIEELNLPQYNVLIGETIRNSVNDMIEQHGLQNVENQITEILGTNKETISFVELIEEFKNAYREDAAKEDYESFTLIFDSVTAGESKFIYIDPRPGQEKYKCMYSLFIGSDGKITRASQEYERYSSKRLWAVGSLYNFKALLSKMYATGTVIEFDCQSHEIETYWDYDGDCDEY